MGAAPPTDVVVVVDEARQGREPVRVGVVGPHVGPLAQQGAMEAFDLAIRLGSIAAGALVDDTEFGERVPKGREVT